eukprot:7289450-Prorocentrum_lima.AAC.1
MVGDHIYGVFCAYNREFQEKWQQLHRIEHPDKSYAASVLHTCRDATGAGILEVSAACRAYCLQAIICVQEAD